METIMLRDCQGRRKYLTPRERRAFMALAGALEGLEAALCLTLAYTGCRISEALNLRPGHLDLQERVLIFETLKRRTNGHFRAVPIPDALVARLGQATLLIDADRRIWPWSRSTAYRRVKDTMQRARIDGPHASPKGLRHGFGIACAEQGIPLNLIRRWLGHASLETTAIYVDAVGREERRFAKRLWQ